MSLTAKNYDDISRGDVVHVTLSRTTELMTGEDSTISVSEIQCIFLGYGKDRGGRYVLECWAGGPVYIPTRSIWSIQVLLHVHK